MPPKPASKGAKKAASFDFRLKLGDTDARTTTTATKRVVVGKDKHTEQSGADETSQTKSETAETETAHTVTQVCTTPPSTQFTFIDVPLFNVHTNTGVEFQTVKSRTRKRATRAAYILAAGERAGQSQPTTAAVSNYFATLDLAAISASWSGDSEPDMPPTAAQRPRRSTPPPPPPPPPAPIQPAGSTSVREPAVVIKLEGEDRPFPSAPEVLQGVLNILKQEGVTIEGMVRTGACFYEVWPLNHAHTERIMGALDQRTIILC